MPSSGQLERPTPGQIVRVRQRTYLGERTEGSDSTADATLVQLACVDDDAQGQPLQVLWEHEVDREIMTGEAWESIASRGFDEPRLFAAYLHALRWNCATSTNPRLFQSPFRAGIRLDAYQLEPLRKKKKPWRYRWPDDFRDEVLARPLDLNRKRAKEERLAGKTAGSSKKSANRGAKKTTGESSNGTGPKQGRLFT